MSATQTPKLRRARGESAGWMPYLLVSPAFAWFAVFFVIPLLLLLVMSFRGYVPTKGITETFTLAHYVKFLTDGFYLGHPVADPSSWLCWSPSSVCCSAILKPII